MLYLTSDSDETVTDTMAGADSDDDNWPYLEGANSDAEIVE